MYLTTTTPNNFFYSLLMITVYCRRFLTIRYSKVYLKL